MVRRQILIGLVLGLLACTSGCGVFRSILYEPFGPGTMCDPEHCCNCPPAQVCGPRCVERCAPRCAPACQPDCDPCGDMCADPCGDPCCESTCDPCSDPCARPCGPLSCLFAIFGPPCSRGGCGEIYWGDFHGDPPDCCDPCDRMANFTGGYSGGGYHGGMAARPAYQEAPAYAAARKTTSPAPNPQLPAGAKLISQSDRVVSPEKAKALSRRTRSPVTQARSSGTRVMR